MHVSPLTLLDLPLDCAYPHPFEYDLMRFESTMLAYQ